jgi:hypothetical protein
MPRFKSSHQNRSVQALKQIAQLVVEQGEDAALSSMAAEGCRLFRTFQGTVVDEENGAACVLGLGNTRCLWFGNTAIVPAR